VAPDDADSWAAVGAGLDPHCVRHLRDRLAGPGLFDVTAPELASAADCSVGDAETLLQRAQAEGLLIERIVFTCPCCTETLSEDDAGEDVCPRCQQPFADRGTGEPERTVHYSRFAAPGRSVPWVLVLHGMNTRGAWQEQLSWLLATTYGRSVPVFIYKYGRVRAGVLLGFRRRRIMQQLAMRITELSGTRESDRLGPRPDVIAHSFGTWLIGHALASTEHSLDQVKVGRVILLGSILRPDFPWPDICKRDRAEAVLNHFGARDAWAGIGGYVIYDAGPSGRRGFAAVDRDGATQVALARREPEFSHSSFFEPATMQRAYTECWQPFLTAPAAQLANATTTPQASHWKPPPRPLRFAAATLAFCLAASIASFMALALIVGLAQLVA
jgi:hypothetical protein